MATHISIQPFPFDAESDGFIAALSSVVCAAKKYTDDTPYWCAPNNRYCTKCGGCIGQSVAQHQLSLYHYLLTASGMAFGFDYPEDDCVDYHTFPNTPVGWRWDDEFLANIMDLGGVSYVRYKNKTVAEIRELVKSSIDAGYPAMIANNRTYPHEMAWVSCWKIVCGCNHGITVMNYGGEIAEETDGTYDDVIVITGEKECSQTFIDVLRRIYAVLTDPSHDALEADIMSDLSHVTPENAVGLSYKIVGINGVPIEARWHAAEAFSSPKNLIHSLSTRDKIGSDICDLIFQRYLMDNNNETHGIGWKIYSCLHAGPETGYAPTSESIELIQKPEVQDELKKLYKIVFDNDRAVAAGIKAVLDSIKE